MPERTHKDLPREEVTKLAEETLAHYNGMAKVYFKFTCHACGQRCTMEEPNTLYESGECFVCNHVTPIKEAGFMLVLEISKPHLPEPPESIKGGVWDD